MKVIQNGRFESAEEHNAWLDKLLEGIDDGPSLDDGAGLNATSPNSGSKLTAPEVPQQTHSVASGPHPPSPLKEDSTTPSYHFPARDGNRYEHLSFGDLKRALEQKIQEGFPGAGRRNYDAVRADLCAIHLEFNRRGQWAPRFRGMPRLSRGSSMPDVENMLRDRQVIDSHWLSVRYKGHEVANKVYEAILQGSTFDFELAERFACEPWRACTKATYLNLSPMMEWELSAIQSERVRKKWTVLQDGDLKGNQVRQLGAKQVRMRLVVTSRQQGLISSWVNTWIAASICERSWVATSKMLALMTGEAAPDVKQVARTHKAMSEALARYKATRASLI
jgi:hypothetical protein